MKKERERKREKERERKRERKRKKGFYTNKYPRKSEEIGKYEEIGNEIPLRKCNR